MRGNGALTHVELVPWALRFSRGGGGVVDIFVAATVAVGPTCVKRDFKNTLHLKFYFFSRKIHACSEEEEEIALAPVGMRTVAAVAAAAAACATKRSGLRA